MREQMKDAPASCANSKVEFDVRSYYRDNVEGRRCSTRVNEAWAGGGAGSSTSNRPALRHRVPRLHALQFVSDLCPVSVRQHTVLPPDQQGYTVVGQLYGRLRLIDETYIMAGRALDHAVSQPARQPLTPNTFYGYVLQSTIGDPESASRRSARRRLYRHHQAARCRRLPVDGAGRRREHGAPASVRPVRCWTGGRHHRRDQVLL